ncbi:MULTISPECIES: hypothetical protein [unclassified Moritella]|uniref:hypothetical protein n=1 Tax=unclassified Moritella TaxID=2637987 RepID=UPI001BAA6951|nr:MULTISPECIES: hypothetical protein [unclassified Moritella]QUM84893.1 hypothetical protein HWV02_10485 [Moritella sp. 28]QUM89135.1 hypothetical protein HWV03_10165 [Moritella sp. 36]
MEQLIITADLDDFSVGLTGKANLNDFSGFGEAWFNLDEVTVFCKKLKQLASEMAGTAELVGSQSKPDGSEYLETFSIRCYVLSASKLNGIIGVHVTLADYPYSDCRNNEIRKLSGELQLRNHKIEEFSGNLLKLINNSQSETVLYGGTGI